MIEIYRPFLSASRLGSPRSRLRCSERLVSIRARLVSEKMVPRDTCILGVVDTKAIVTVVVFTAATTWDAGVAGVADSPASSGHAGEENSGDDGVELHLEEGRR